MQPGPEDTRGLRVLVAPDSFKGSLDASAAAAAIAAGVGAAAPDAEICCLPMADGGEGTLDALTAAGGFGRRTMTVTDPLGRPLTGHYAVRANSAVVELAVASGLTLLHDAELDPRRASTRGTGELLRAAAAELPLGGQVLLCLGGSAANDAGTGLLRALGVRFLDAHGDPLPEGGAALARLESIDLSGLPDWVRGLNIEVACDVTHPLVGPQGASVVFGPQKGAAPPVVAELDRALTRFADVVQRQLGVALHHLPGAGAAGGTAGGLHAVLGARLRPGAALVAAASGLTRRLGQERWDLVWTGEGCLDPQSAGGKVVSEVAALAGARGFPVVALAGQVDSATLDALPGLTAAFALADRPLSLTESRARTAELLTRQAEQLTRLYAAALRRPPAG
ncbi:glycerate kinase (plasmid) [Deinococcus proteolyticus MRP]|uniref:Glycerate kinase n=1 Tax=Deinococcus proteolyticus (strain ATCC 35074 / DSM 20540 / JCM 6276 / NBRC 101906 / NCIMB 13154 / VKM Ac-1939 / CCM 2703 / MRP) TaxID=693977 RepID=F0RQT0_DEIPM|nr:glycerate kinase [Deinococcus proteolyticus]ADY27639.1 glycerate kinase [Deinococcus proteolyticus MRP]